MKQQKIKNLILDYENEKKKLFGIGTKKEHKKILKDLQIKYEYVSSQSIKRNLIKFKIPFLKIEYEFILYGQRVAFEEVLNFYKNSINKLKDDDFDNFIKLKNLNEEEKENWLDEFQYDLQGNKIKYNNYDNSSECKEILKKLNILRKKPFYEKYVIVVEQFQKDRNTIFKNYQNIFGEYLFSVLLIEIEKIFGLNEYFLLKKII